MAWTTPFTYVTGQVMSSGNLNKYIRDNFNALALQRGEQSGINNFETTTSTTYTDLTTIGPKISLVLAGDGSLASAKALVMVSAYMANTTQDEFAVMGVAVSGATTVAASDARALAAQGGSANSFEVNMANFWVQENLNPGTNIFTAKYRVTGGTGTFLNRFLFVMELSPDA